jgi:indole-3-glycerol phosphate synthase
MSTILERIVTETRHRLAASSTDRGALEAAVDALRDPPIDTWTRLSSPGPHIIAEVKRRSPSAGTLRTDIEPASLALIYAESGASAISVLTEPTHFGGSLEDLRAVASAVNVPSLRKDFIVSDVQLLEARAAGASMALLIVAALTASELTRLVASSTALGLLPLVETHTLREIKVAVDAGAPMIGVNSRDLRDFSIDIARAEKLRSAIPSGTLAVAESGIHTPDDLGRLSDSGYDLFLIGTSLMTSEDPASTLRSFLARGAR